MRQRGLATRHVAARLGVHKSWVRRTLATPNDNLTGRTMRRLAEAVGAELEIRAVVRRKR